jgi:signal transduction histidine kinase
MTTRKHFRGVIKFDQGCETTRERVSFNHIERIFPPFFYKTKGPGNGLGLSLTYDIIKGTWWEIKVENQGR